MNVETLPAWAQTPNFPHSVFLWAPSLLQGLPWLPCSEHCFLHIYFAPWLGPAAGKVGLSCTRVTAMPAAPKKKAGALAAPGAAAEFFDDDDVIDSDSEGLLSGDEGDDLSGSEGEGFDGVSDELMGDEDDEEDEEEDGMEEDDSDEEGGAAPAAGMGRPSQQQKKPAGPKLTKQEEDALLAAANHSATTDATVLELEVSCCFREGVLGRALQWPARMQAHARSRKALSACSLMQ